MTTEIVFPLPSGWIRRDLFDGVVDITRDPQYSRACTFDFTGRELAMEVTAWPHSDQIPEIAAYTFRGGALSYSDGDDVVIPVEDAETVTGVAVYLESNTGS